MRVKCHAQEHNTMRTARSDVQRANHSFNTFSNFTGTSKITLSDNVKLMSWLPQNDILGHPKTRLFIGHAGTGGILESSYHGVPMICSPFYADQFDNAQMAKRAGFAETVNLETTSAEEFVSLIHKVLTQSR